MVKIVIDMMGGDDVPGIVLNAIKKAVEDFKNLEVILFGDEPQYNLSHERIEFRHCIKKIGIEDEPACAIKRKKDSLMTKIAEAVKSREADGYASAGNAGVLMSVGLSTVRRIKGVARPALAVTLPTTDGRGFVFLDVGANVGARAGYLLQYA